MYVIIFLWIHPLSLQYFILFCSLVEVIQFLLAHLTTAIQLWIQCGIKSAGRFSWPLTFAIYLLSYVFCLRHMLWFSYRKICQNWSNDAKLTTLSIVGYISQLFTALVSFILSSTKNLFKNVAGVVSRFNSPWSIE